jgi:rhomboid family GlyGly-CTERM serine protease
MTFVLTFAALIASFPGLGTLLQYNHDFAAGNLYRTITCHWTHHSASHFIWSLGAFIVLGSICELQSRTRFVACLIFSSVIIPFGLYYLAPPVNTYRGLSGIDSALFFLASMPLIFHQHRDPRPTRTLFILLPMLFLAKLLYEQFAGRAIFANTEGAFVPVPLAHLIGAIAGTACSIWPIRRRRTFAL